MSIKKGSISHSSPKFTIYYEIDTTARTAKIRVKKDNKSQFGYTFNVRVYNTTTSDPKTSINISNQDMNYKTYDSGWKSVTCGSAGDNISIQVKCGANQCNNNWNTSSYKSIYSTKLENKKQSTTTEYNNNYDMTYQLSIQGVTHLTFYIASYVPATITKTTTGQSPVTIEAGEPLFYITASDRYLSVAQFNNGEFQSATAISAGNSYGDNNFVITTPNSRWIADLTSLYRNQKYYIQLWYIDNELDDYVELTSRRAEVSTLNSVFQSLELTSILSFSGKAEATKHINAAYADENNMSRYFNEDERLIVLNYDADRNTLINGINDGTYNIFNETTGYKPFGNSQISDTRKYDGTGVSSILRNVPANSVRTFIYITYGDGIATFNIYKLQAGHVKLSNPTNSQTVTSASVTIRAHGEVIVNGQWQSVNVATTNTVIFYKITDSGISDDLNTCSTSGWIEKQRGVQDNNITFTTNMRPHSKKYLSIIFIEYASDQTTELSRAWWQNINMATDTYAVRIGSNWYMPLIYNNSTWNPVKPLIYHNNAWHEAIIAKYNYTSNKWEVS